MISLWTDFGRGRLRRGGVKMISGENMAKVLAVSGRSSVGEVAREPVGEVDRLSEEEMVGRGYEVVRNVPLDSVVEKVRSCLGRSKAEEVVVVYNAPRCLATVYIPGEHFEEGRE